MAGQGPGHRAATSARRSTSRSTSASSAAWRLAIALPGTNDSSLTARSARATRASSLPAVADRRDGVPRPPRPARQDRLPRGPQRAVRAGAGLLRVLPVRRHDRRRQAPDRVHLGAAPRSPSSAGTSPTSSRRWCPTRRGCRPRRSSGCTTATSRRTCVRPSRPVGSRTSAARSSSCGTPLVLLFSHNTTIAADRCGADDRLPPVHHLDVPAGGAAGVERPVRVHHGLPVPRLPNANGYGLGDMDAGAARAHRWPACCSSRSSATSGRTSSRSCRRCGSTRATGPRRCGRSPRGRRRSSTSTSRSPPSMQKQQLDDDLRSRGRGGRHAADARAGARCTARAAALNSVMMNTLGPDIDTYDLREAEFSCNALIGFNFGDGHLHNQQLHRGAAAALPVRAGRVHRRLDRVRGHRPRVPGLLGDGRRRRHRRARPAPRRRLRRRAAVAAQRPDRDRGHLADGRLRAGAARRRPPPRPAATGLRPEPQAVA